MEDSILVIQTIAGCPAEKVGVLPGDRIIYIDNELVAGVKIKTSDVYKRLRGPKGTEVTIKVRRGSKAELIEFKIIRDKIPIYSVDATYMIGKDMGYIKINQFMIQLNNSTINLLKIKSKFLEKIIFILKYNLYKDYINITRLIFVYVQTLGKVGRVQQTSTTILKKRNMALRGRTTSGCD